MMISRKKLLSILIIFLLTGCIIDPADDSTTINTGDEHGNCYTPPKTGVQSKNLEIFANPQESSNYNPKNGAWIDTGITKSNVGDLKKISIKYINGEVELCKNHDLNFEIPYSMCSDGSTINYDKIKATKLGFESNAEEMCPKTKRFIDIMEYKQTGIFVEPDDLVIFSPIKSDISIGDCGNIPNEIGQSDINLYNKKYTTKQLCEGIDIRDGNIDKLTVKLNNEKSKLLGLITNDPGPQGNKIDYAGAKIQATDTTIAGIIDNQILISSPDTINPGAASNTLGELLDKNYSMFTNSGVISKKIINISAHETTLFIGGSINDVIAPFLDKIQHFSNTVIHALALLNGLKNSDPEIISNKNFYKEICPNTNACNEVYNAINTLNLYMHLEYDARYDHFQQNTFLGDINIYSMFYIIQLARVALTYNKYTNSAYDNITENFIKKMYPEYKKNANHGWISKEFNELLNTKLALKISNEIKRCKISCTKNMNIISEGGSIAEDQCIKALKNIMFYKNGELNNIQLLIQADKNQPNLFTSIDKANLNAVKQKFKNNPRSIYQINCRTVDAAISLLEKFSTSYHIHKPAKMIYFKDWIQGKEFALNNISNNSLNAFDCKNIQPQSPYDQWDLYNLNIKCNTMYHSFDLKEWHQDIEDVAKNITSNKIPKIYATSLIAKIGSNNSYNAIGEECWPDNTKKTKCSEYRDVKTGLQMYTKYIPQSSGELMFLIKDQKHQYTNNMGGYHINVKHRCPYSDGERLYTYIGSNPNKIQPGDSATDFVTKQTVIDFTSYKDDDHLYFAIKPRLNNYQNIKGKYNIALELHETAVVPSIAIGQIFKYIRDILAYDSDKSYVKQHFESLVKNMTNSIKAILVLYITYVGLGYATGLIPISKEHIVISLIRIGFITQLISPNSWKFFNDMFFKSILPFINTLVSMLSLGDNSTSDFTFFDSTFGALFSSQSWRKMLAVFLSGPIGFVVFIILILAYWKFTKLCLKGLLMYAMAMMAIAFLITLFPLFLTFILFKQTKYLFDAWLKMIVGYIAQPAFYFISVGFMIQLLQYAIEDLFYFQLCNLCVYGLVIGILPGILSFIPPLVICFADGWLPKTYIDYSKNGGGGWQHIPEYFTSDIGDLLKGEFFGMPFSINILFFFVVILQSMDIMAKVSQTMASCMVGFSYAHQGISAATNEMIGQGKGLLGIDQKSKNRRQMSKDMLEKFKKNISSAKINRSDNKSNINSRNNSENNVPKNDLATANKTNTKRLTNDTLTNKAELGTNNKTKTDNQNKPTKYKDSTNMSDPINKKESKNNKTPRK